MERMPIAICMLFAFATHSLIGQEVTDTLQYNTSLTLGGAYKTGLLNQTNISGSFVNSIQRSNWIVYNRTSYFYSRVNNVQLLDDWTVVSKLSYSFTKQVKISPTLFHLYKSNLLYRILNSHLFLLGASITPLENKKALLFVGVGFDDTHYAGETFMNSELLNSKRRFGVSTIHVENTHQFANNTFSLTYSLFYFQSFKEAADYTIWIIPGFQVALSKKLSFTINYDFRYRNVHLVDLPAIKQALTFNLSISFQT